MPSPSTSNVEPVSTLALFQQDLTAGLSPEALGVFGPNKSAPVHRWVSFTEGFSAQLVAQELTDLPALSFVFDPFGGTGTTPLVAVQLGRNAAWSEVNPYLRDAATTKVAAVRATAETRSIVSQELEQAIRTGRVPSAPTQHPLIDADAAREFFPAGVVGELLGWIARFDECATPLASKLGRLAVASCAINASNMKRAVDLRRRTPSELQRHKPDVDTAVRARITDMLDDLGVVPQASGEARCVAEDARHLPPDLPPIDLVVTSPPYLNGTNYCRNTKLELLLLGLISSEADLMPLRARAITAGINNVSKRIDAPKPLDAVEPVARQLDAKTYDPRIPTMVRAYFSDMHTVLAGLRSKMSSGGRLVLDIGDSRFAGVHVDTPNLLAQIAEGIGWRLSNQIVIRSRVAKDGNPLCQKLLHLCSN
jgi:hypothetical protein